MTSETRDGAQAPRRVVITGLGLVTSIGTGVEVFAAGLRAGRSGAKPITAFDTPGFAHANGCAIDDFDPKGWLRVVDVNELGRAAQFSVAAARMAVADAGLTEDELRACRSLVSIGTTDGESRDLDGLVETELEQGTGNFDPVVARRIGAAQLSTAIVRELGLTDVEAATLPTACAAGNYAVGSGFDAKIGRASCRER